MGTQLETFTISSSKEKRIKRQIAKLKNRASKLLNEAIDLDWELSALGTGHVTETIKGKVVEKVFWKEFFLDEDTGERITIERSKPIKIDGVKVNAGGQPIQYYPITNE